MAVWCMSCVEVAWIMAGGEADMAGDPWPLAGDPLSLARDGLLSRAYKVRRPNFGQCLMSDKSDYCSL